MSDNLAIIKDVSTPGTFLDIRPFDSDSDPDTDSDPDSDPDTDSDPDSDFSGL